MILALVNLSYRGGKTGISQSRGFQVHGLSEFFTIIRGIDNQYAKGEKLSWGFYTSMNFHMKKRMSS
ncbi:hypothetical protein Ct9H90mP29_15340 [bacterium]|nr:MAG: hypothetical protein Ct9H90mP29_15340 [bacterium]